MTLSCILPALIENPAQGGTSKFGLGTDLNADKSCHTSYVCEAALGWGDALATSLSAKTGIVDENGTDIRFQWAADLSETMVDLPNHLPADALVQKNYGVAIKTGFKAIFAELPRFPLDDQMKIIQSFLTWIKSPSSHCHVNYVCDAAQLVSELLPSSRSCDLLKLSAGIFVKNSDAYHQSNTTIRRFLGTAKDLVDRNLLESTKQVRLNRDSACSKPKSGSSPVVDTPIGAEKRTKATLGQ